MFKISDSFIKIFLGFCLVLGLNSTVAFIAMSIAYMAFDAEYDNITWVLLLVVRRLGIVQLIYIIPLSVWLSRKREWGFITGGIIGAVITLPMISSFWEALHTPI
ncbi:MAG TPA: hypothetical protein V6D26_22430 [Stenomitos sp.]